MKQFIFLFVLIFSGFLFSQVRNSEFIGGEKQLKKWNREWKVRLIEEENPEWRDLADEIRE